MNKHTRSVSLIDGHTEEMTDTEIKKALECCNSTEKGHCLNKCPYYNYSANCMQSMINDTLDLINRLQAKNKELDEKLIIQKGLIDTQKAEIEKLNVELVGMRGACESYKMHYDNAQAEVERLQKENQQFADIGKMYSEVRAEAIKELSEKITEIFMRYAHLHTYAEGARKDFIETVDGKEIEMQSVWDVITLQMNGVAEYEEMSRLQKNIETIEKDRLLTELEKDFRLLVKEMTEVSE